MDPPNATPRLSSDISKTPWTKFSERQPDASASKSTPSRQTHLENYWSREAVQRSQDADGVQQQPSHGSRIAVVLSPSSSPNKVLVTTPKAESSNAIPPNILELSKRVKKSIGILSQSVARDSAHSSATPPQTSASTPNSQSRGRPKGWKPGMSYAAMRGNTPPRWKAARTPRQPRAKAPQPGFARRPGRPPRHSPPPKELYHKANPQFIAFLCEWDGCKAELHNLDTLRRHIHVVHEHIGVWTCKWAQCKLDRAMDAQDWHSHLEEAHLVPFGWHVGDGPCNTSGMRTKLPDNSQDVLPDFLMGSDGQQVTPSIKDQELEDFATWKDNRRKLKELLIQRDENLPDESSETSEEGD